MATMATVAIVGGGGFIGVRLARVLRNSGHEVTIVDIDEPRDGDSSYRLADVRDYGSLRRALEGAEVVYNLAAVHRDDIRPISRYDEVNVEGAANLCRACRELRIGRIVFTSTVAVYGEAVPDTAETAVTDPDTAYGRSKLLAERVHREWQLEDPSARSLVTVRPAVVFGEGNRGNVYELVRQIAAGHFVFVGSGGNRKSMAYVGNLSAFLTHVLGLDHGSHLFNYADKPDYSMKELVDTVANIVNRRLVRGIRIPFAVAYTGAVLCDFVSAMTGRSFSISAIRVKKFCSTTTFCTRRAEAIGFRAPFGLKDALLKTISYEANVSLPS